MLVDTDVLVSLLRGRESARELVRRAAEVELSAVTYMELAQGVRNRAELQRLRRTVGLQGWRVLPVTEPISHRATTYIENHALTHGMRVADALIAATAVESERTLVTGNVRHYRFVPGILLESYRP